MNTKFLTADESNKRIDTYITDKNGDLSRSYVQKLINDGDITVNNKVVKSNYKVKKNVVNKLQIISVTNLAYPVL